MSTILSNFLNVPARCFLLTKLRHIQKLKLEEKVKLNQYNATVNKRKVKTTLMTSPNTSNPLILIRNAREFKVENPNSSVNG